MKKVKNKQFIIKKKQIGKVLMITGLLGIFFSILEPIFVTKGCFGYGIADVLIYVVPIAMLIVGYRIYNNSEINKADNN